MIRTPSVTVHAGHVLEVLATLPDSSIDCAVTSPPYWGLRAYGTEPQEWGGTDGCSHQWEYQRADVIVGSQNPNGKSTLATTGTKHNATSIPTLTATCEKCDAWRGELGLEPTPELFVEHLVAIFREVRRILRPHGALWLNIGDSYSSGGRSTYDTKGGVTGLHAPRVPRMRNTGRNDTNRETPGGRGGSFRGGERAQIPVLETPGIKPKDMVGIPWMTAFALRADGWYLRSDVIWSKPNPMPESVTDRPTKAHEYLFLLTKAEGYYYDRVAIREELRSGPSDLRKMAEAKQRIGGKTIGNGDTLYAANESTNVGKKRGVGGGRRQTIRALELFAKSGLTQEHLDAIRAVGLGDAGKTRALYGEKNEQRIRELADEAKRVLGGYVREFLGEATAGRNARSVWEIATQPYEGAHFATFPEELPRRCISASCPMQICNTCGKPRERIVDDPLPDDPPDHSGIRGRDEFNVASIQSRMTGGDYMEWREDHPVTTLGWTDCGHDDYVPGVVLDPFAGSGTTLAVAAMLGVHAVGVELNSEYLGMIQRRVAAAEMERSRGGTLDEPIVAVSVADMGPLWEVRE